MDTTDYYFFLGTNAELIKMMPLLRRFKRAGVPLHLIATGQNFPLEDELLEMSEVGGVDLQITARPIPQAPFWLATWFFAAFFKSLVLLPLYMRRTRTGRQRAMVVIGDTISTILGAMLGRLFGFEVVHIEAGLRSGNWLRPFPEEISRQITTALAQVNFCPNQQAVCNIRKAAVKVNMGHNTQLEAINMALDRARDAQAAAPLVTGEYFVLVLHRQENIYNRQLVASIVDKMVEVSGRMKCVFIMHEPTRKALEQHGLMRRVLSAENVVLLDRLDFVDFARLLSGCEFLITDGGGNQQEAYHLGIPCLILRSETEGPEGLGSNALLYGGDLGMVDGFVEEYGSYRKEPLKPERQPSEVILETLVKT